MPLNSTGAISLGGTTSGQSIAVELGGSGTAQISLNDSSVRTLGGVASGAISLSNFYGKANQFAFTIAANQTNANLRTLAVNAGWNQTSKVVATINSGVVISSNSTGTPALTINGSWPGGIELTNNGTIVGMGGSGGSGGYAGPGPWNTGPGGGGGGGGTALSVSVATSVRNNGTIAGGGGGAGGAPGVYDPGTCCTPNGWYGGNGGSGGRSSNFNSPGGGGGPDAYGAHNGSPGGAGTFSSAGTGGNGPGGNWGASGGAGSAGAGGSATSGATNITWLATGTRFGAIN